MLRVRALQVGGTGFLGVWQLRRYFWKKELVDERQELLAAPPVVLPLADELHKMTLADFAYRRVTVEGHFDRSRVALVGPRPPPKDTTPEFRGPDAAGYAVIAPLVRPDGSRVLVNAGWMPMSMATEEGIARCLADAPGGKPRTVAGVIGRGDVKHGYSPDNDTAGAKFLWIELPAVAAHCGATSDAFIVDTVGELRRGHFPLVQPLDKFGDFYVTPFKHLVYSATWFCLAAAGTAMTFVRFRRAPARALGAASSGKPRKSHAQYAFEASRRAVSLAPRAPPIPPVAAPLRSIVYPRQRRELSTCVRMSRGPEVCERLIWWDILYLLAAVCAAEGHGITRSLRGLASLRAPAGAGELT